MALKLSKYRSDPIRQLLSQSALFRYFFYNLSILNAIQTIFNDNNSFIANTHATVDERKLKRSKQAVDQFLLDLPQFTRLDPNKILFIVDSVREDIYSDVDRNSYAKEMFQYFIKQAQSAGFDLIDMDERFRSDYVQNQKSFEFADNGHWNSYAHHLVYKQILQSNSYKSFKERNRQ